MPLTPYSYHRGATPPVAEVPALSQGRRPSDASQWSLDSAELHTPLDRSPARQPPAGTKLLPKLRTQDHALAPPHRDHSVESGYQGVAYQAPTNDYGLYSASGNDSALYSATGNDSALFSASGNDSALFSAAGIDSVFFPPADDSLFPTPSRTHRRAVSHGYEGLSPVATRPSYPRCTTSPPERLPTTDPESAISACFSALSEYSTFDSPVSFAPASKGLAHGRSVSTSNIDHSKLLKYCNPIARAPPPFYAAAPPPPTAYWSAYDGAATFTPVPTSAISQTATECYDLPEELQCLQPDQQMQTLDNYLRAPNPAIDLCSTPAPPAARGAHPHFWFDIRNLRPWKAFTLDAVMAVPDFPELLHMPFPSSAAPEPSESLAQHHLRPDTEATLTATLQRFYATKVNHALRVFLPPHAQLTMRASSRGTTGPAFVSSAQNATAGTVSGTGRVVGLVRSYRTWNSGQRHGSKVDQVEYLKGLAALHHSMREHGTRYGFIMTETELVCARAGTEETPYFGHLELSTPIETRLNGSSGLPTPPLDSSSSSSASHGLTACLALWYLHMLAKEEALPGQPGWRMHVGAPAALTRQRVLKKRDAWLPEPKQYDTRQARTLRGWIWPHEAFNKKKEGGKAAGKGKGGRR